MGSKIMAQENWGITVNTFDNNSTGVAAFPATGVTGELYLDKSTALDQSGYEGDLYQWNGTTYILSGGPRPHPHPHA